MKITGVSLIAGICFHISAATEKLKWFSAVSDATCEAVKFAIGHKTIFSFTILRNPSSFWGLGALAVIRF